MTEYEWRVQRPAKKGGFNLDVQNRVADEVFSRCRIYFPLRETVQLSKGGMDVSAFQVGPGEADEVLGSWDHLLSTKILGFQYLSASAHARL